MNKTVKLRDEKEVLDRQHRTDIEAQKNLDENLQQLKSRFEELNSQEEEMNARLNRDQLASKDHEKEMKRLKKEREEMRNKSQKSRYLFLMLLVTIIFSDIFFCCVFQIRSS